MSELLLEGISDDAESFNDYLEVNLQRMLRPSLKACRSFSCCILSKTASTRSSFDAIKQYYKNYVLNQHLKTTLNHYWSVILLLLHQDWIRLLKLEKYKEIPSISSKTISFSSYRYRSIFLRFLLANWICYSCSFAFFFKGLLSPDCKD